MFGTVVDGIVKDGQQQVLFVYFVCMLDTGLQHGQFQNVARLLVQHQVCGVYGAPDFVLPDTHLQFGLNRLQVQVQTMKEVDHRTVIAPEHAQQQVFRSYGTAGESRCLLSGESEYL